jgi:hypothetical protein
VYFTFAAGSTAAQRQVSFNLLTGDGVTFEQIPLNADHSASVTLNYQLNRNPVIPVQYPSSKLAYGTQTTPAAGTTIASTATLQAGLYEVQWITELQGTTTAGTDNDNFELTVGASVQVQSVNPFSIGQYTQAQANVFVTTPASINVKNINLATTGAVYSAQISAAPVAFGPVQGALPDIVMQSGWQTEILIGNIEATDQISNITYLVEQFASDAANGGWAIEEDEQLRRLLDIASREGASW